MGRPPLNLTRMHVNLSQEVLDRMDLIVGEKGRSKFIRDAVDQLLDRLAPLPARSGPPYLEFAIGEARLSASGTAAILAAIKREGKSLDEFAAEMGFKNDPAGFLAMLLGHAVLTRKASAVLGPMLPEDHFIGQFPNRGM